MNPDQILFLIVASFEVSKILFIIGIALLITYKIAKL